jgi:type IV secretory pathway component VirB8
MAKSPIPVKDDALSTRELLLTLNKRLAVAAIASSVAALMVSGALFSLFPLKQNIPYIIETHTDGSVSVPEQTEAAKYNPSTETLNFFISRWVADAFAINQYSTVQSLDPRARALLRGENAIKMYDDFVKKDGKFKTLVDDPTLIRDVEVVSVTPIAGIKNGVIADVKLITRKNGEKSEERKLITIYYEIGALSDRNDIKLNPIGLFITDFKVGAGNA